MENVIKVYTIFGNFKIHIRGFEDLFVPYTTNYFITGFIKNNKIDIKKISNYEFLECNVGKLKITYWRYLNNEYEISGELILYNKKELLQRKINKLLK